MNQITLQSHAKLNIFLKVVNKRPDGYHNLHTLFERIDLCDDIRFSANNTGKIKISCDHPHVPVGPKNLIYKAVEMLRSDFGLKYGVSVNITKRIPVAAGLAGGSSNAATTLLGLNKIWNLSLSRAKLMQYGKALGSDVPFFLNDCSWGVGVERGDKIKRVSTATKLWHILVVPRIKMYSREVFTQLNLQLTKRDDDVNILIRSLKNSNIKKVGALLFNDLESSILNICPRLLNAKKRLQLCELEGISFSGSGPAIFGITVTKENALRAKMILEKRYKQVFVVRTF